MAFIAWGLGGTPDGDLGNAANYWDSPVDQHGSVPGPGDDVTDFSATPPSSGTLTCNSFDCNGERIDQTGSSCVYNCAIVNPLIGDQFGAVGNDTFAGGIPAFGLYGINQLAVGSQVKPGVHNGPYIGTFGGHDLAPDGTPYAGLL